MLSVEPYIAFPGTCKDAIAFYQSAAGAQLLFSQTYGNSPMEHAGDPDNIMHCTLQIGDSKIMMCDDPSPEGGVPGTMISLAIGLKDIAKAQELFDNLAVGGTVIMPLEKTFWAEGFGMLNDKFGIKWMINCEAPQAA
jgi:PhnB protein